MHARDSKAVHRQSEILFRHGPGPWNPADRVKDAELQQAFEQAQRGELEVAFLDYDGSLNSQGQTGKRAAPAKKVGFGSGTIPNP